MPRIQDVDPARVIYELISKSYGTYIVRRSTSNDESISQIQINRDRNPNASSRPYVILSIRVDEKLYKCVVMHYRLLQTEIDSQEGSSQLLKQYNSLKNNSSSKIFTPLTYEHKVQIQDQSWSIDPTHLKGLNFSTSMGDHNAGTCVATWKCPNQHDVKMFIKRFQKGHRYFKHEFHLLKKVSFFHIVAVYGQYSNSQYDYLVLAYGGRSLGSLCPLQTRSIKSKMHRVVNIGFQIANGMVYLEKQNIVHRDLTADNVLVDQYGFVRIADFEHAIQKEEGKNNLERSMSTLGEKRFQFRFLPPECLPEPRRGDTPISRSTTTMADIYASFSSKSDVWSFGILLIQLMIVNPSKPYPKLQNDRIDVPQYVKMDRKIHECPKECSFDLYLQLKRCWAYDAKDRASFCELRESMLQLESIFR